MILPILIAYFIIDFFTFVLFVVAAVWRLLVNVWICSIYFEKEAWLQKKGTKCFIFLCYCQ